MRANIIRGDRAGQERVRHAGDVAMDFQFEKYKRRVSFTVFLRAHPGTACKKRST
jgi:hypothetical protein